MVTKNALCVLYVENDFPSDRLIKDQAALAAFTAEYNSRTGTALKPDDIATQLLSLRKKGELTRVGRDWTGPRFI